MKVVTVNKKAFLTMIFSLLLRLVLCFVVMR